MALAFSGARRERTYYYLCGIVGLIAVGLFAYSQTPYAFAWDEGFHLLTAQLIKNGKRPYLDFFFPQTPLNAYWNAWWMKVFGDTWRVAHGAAALCSAAAVMLTSDFVYTRFRVPGWQLAAAIMTAVLVGVNEMVVEFGTIGQAYGLCLLLVMAAFRASLVAVRREDFWAAGLAGMLAAGAAGATLLSAPVTPVLLIWIAFYAIRGRVAKIVAYCVGAAIPFVPLLLLYLQDRRVVLFNVFDYHAFHRQEEWAGAIAHDVEIVSGWIDSGQALLLLLFGLAGLWWVRRKSGWERPQKGEFYLCAWIPIGITAHLLNAHPTFARYWMFTVPFLASLAAIGLYAVSAKMMEGEARPLWPVLLMTVLVCLGEARSAFGEREDTKWSDQEALAKKVLQVTKPGARMLAFEQVYFLTKRTPPAGFEHADSHKLRQSPELSAKLHVIPQPEVDKLIKSGQFDLVENCNDDDNRRELGLPDMYRQTFDAGDCRLYWEKKKK